MLPPPMPVSDVTFLRPVPAAPVPPPASDTELPLPSDPGEADIAAESPAPAYSFWIGALMWHGSVTPRVTVDVLWFGALAAVTVVICELVEHLFGVKMQVAVGPFEAAGAVLGLLLVMRTNAGYDRWWEARKLWGGIVNQSRNLAVAALAYGPTDSAWRVKFVRWAAAFPHVVRRSLRGERSLPEIERLLGARRPDASPRPSTCPASSRRSWPGCCGSPRRPG